MADGRLYYLNLGTADVRWDPPPCWDAGWEQRASQWSSAEEEVHRTGVVAGQVWRDRRTPAAIPYGREVCGGALVGTDLVAALRPAAGQLLLAVEGSPVLGGRTPTVVEPGPLLGHLAALEACAAEVLEAASARFALSGSRATFTLADLSPRLHGIDRTALQDSADAVSRGRPAFVCGGRRGGDTMLTREGAVLDQTREACADLRECLRSPGLFARALVRGVVMVGGCRV